MRKVTLILLTGLIMFGSAGSSWGDDRDLAGECAAIKAKFLETDESMSKFFNEAAADVRSPKVTKGGLGMGGAKGAGLFYQGGAAIGEAHMSHFTIGGQAGGQV